MNPDIASDEAEGRDRTISADSTVKRAHQHTAGARPVPPAEPAHEGNASPGQ
jgi:hypothetical protein